jgi:zinc transport system permease protein
MLEIFNYPFLIRALVAGSIVGIVLSLLGIFVVLRRMAFFGDAVGHFAFTGIALGFLFSIDPILSAVIFSVLLALGIGTIEGEKKLASDTIIGVFFSGSAALGILIIGMLKGYRSDLFQYLFGDILSVSDFDILISLILGVTIILLTVIFWKKLMQITFSRDLALINALPVKLLDYLLLVLLALATSLSIKIIGIILVTALLIIPAAAAQNLSYSFREMVLFSLLFGISSVILGIIFSYYLNTAAGSTIVLTSILIFILSIIFKRYK